MTEQVFVNGVARPWQPGLLLSVLVEELTANPKGLAVAIDREVVPRSTWSSTIVAPGAEVEIVTAAAGG